MGNQEPKGARPRCPARLSLLLRRRRAGPARPRLDLLPRQVQRGLEQLRREDGQVLVGAVLEAGRRHVELRREALDVQVHGLHLADTEAGAGSARQRAASRLPPAAVRRTARRSSQDAGRRPVSCRRWARHRRRAPRAPARLALNLEGPVGVRGGVVPLEVGVLVDRGLEERPGLLVEVPRGLDLHGVLRLHALLELADGLREESEWKRRQGRASAAQCLREGKAAQGRRGGFCGVSESDPRRTETEGSRKSAKLSLAPWISAVITRALCGRSGRRAGGGMGSACVERGGGGNAAAAGRAEGSFPCALLPF